MNLVLESFNSPPFPFEKIEKYGAMDIIYMFSDGTHDFKLHFEKKAAFGRNVFIATLGQKTPGLKAYKRIVQKFTQPMQTISTILAILKHVREERTDVKGVLLELPAESLGNYGKLVNKIVIRELRTEYRLIDVPFNDEEHEKMGLKGTILVSKPNQFKTVFSGKLFKELLADKNIPDDIDDDVGIVAPTPTATSTPPAPVASKINNDPSILEGLGWTKYGPSRYEMIIKDGKAVIQTSDSTVHFRLHNDDCTVNSVYDFLNATPVSPNIYSIDPNNYAAFTQELKSFSYNDSLKARVESQLGITFKNQGNWVSQKNGVGISLEMLYNMFYRMVFTFGPESFPSASSVKEYLSIVPGLIVQGNGVTNYAAIDFTPYAPLTDTQLSILDMKINLLNTNPNSDITKADKSNSLKRLGWMPEFDDEYILEIKNGRISLDVSNDTARVFFDNSKCTMDSIYEAVYASKLSANTYKVEFENYADYSAEMEAFDYNRIVRSKIEDQLGVLFAGVDGITYASKNNVDITLQSVSGMISKVNFEFLKLNFPNKEAAIIKHLDTIPGISSSDDGPVISAYVTLLPYRTFTNAELGILNPNLISTDGSGSDPKMYSALVNADIGIYGGRFDILLGSGGRLIADASAVRKSGDKAVFTPAFKGDVQFSNDIFRRAFDGVCGFQNGNELLVRSVDELPRFLQAAAKFNTNNEVLLSLNKQLGINMKPTDIVAQRYQLNDFDSIEFDMIRGQIRAIYLKCTKPLERGIDPAMYHSPNSGNPTRYLGVDSYGISTNKISIDENAQISKLSKMLISTAMGKTELLSEPKPEVAPALSASQIADITELGWKRIGESTFESIFGPMLVKITMSGFVGGNSMYIQPPNRSTPTQNVLRFKNQIFFQKGSINLYEFDCSIQRLTKELQSMNYNQSLLDMLYDNYEVDFNAVDSNMVAAVDIFEDGGVKVQAVPKSGLINSLVLTYSGVNRGSILANIKSVFDMIKDENGDLGDYEIVPSGDEANLIYTVFVDPFLPESNFFLDYLLNVEEIMSTDGDQDLGKSVRTIENTKQSRLIYEIATGYFGGLDDLAMSTEDYNSIVQDPQVLRDTLSNHLLDIKETPEPQLIEVAIKDMVAAFNLSAAKTMRDKYDFYLDGMFRIKKLDPKIPKQSKRLTVAEIEDIAKNAKQILISAGLKESDFSRPVKPRVAFDVLRDMTAAGTDIVEFFNEFIDQNPDYTDFSPYSINAYPEVPFNPVSRGRFGELKSIVKTHLEKFEEQGDVDAYIRESRKFPGAYQHRFICEDYDMFKNATYNGWLSLEPAYQALMHKLCIQLDINANAKSQSIPLKGIVEESENDFNFQLLLSENGGQLKHIEKLYADSQAKYAEMGITEFELFRGVSVKDITSYSPAGLESWSTNENVASKFALESASGGDWDAKAIILKMTIPVKYALCSFHTISKEYDMGRYISESEVMVMSGAFRDCDVVAHDLDSYDNPIVLKESVMAGIKLKIVDDTEASYDNLIAAGKVGFGQEKGEGDSKRKARKSNLLDEEQSSTLSSILGDSAVFKYQDSVIKVSAASKHEVLLVMADPNDAEGLESFKSYLEEVLDCEIVKCDPITLRFLKV